MYEISAIKEDLKIGYFLQDNICRLCWGKKGKIEIVEENHFNVKNICFIGLINDCLGIETPAGLPPKRICETCMRNVQKFSKFKNYCQETNRRLCELFKIHEDTIKTESIVFFPKKEPEIYNIEYSPERDLGVKDLIKSKNVGPGLSPIILDEDSYVLSEEDIPLNQRNTQVEKTKVTVKKTDKSTFCTSCRLELSTVENLNAHTHEIHNNINLTYKCYGCETTFNNRKKRLQHERKCKSLENGFKCTDCNKTLKTRNAYEMHIGTHQNVDKDLLKCKIGAAEVKSKEQLRLHLRNNLKKKKYVCEHCGRVFSRPDYLHKHKMTHTGARTHACPHCSYRAAQRSSLNVHIRKHTGERPYKCPVCPQRCVSSSNLAAHARRHDPTTKSYQCTICDKKFGYKGSLDEHVNIAHAQLSRTFSCQECGSVYSRARGLRQHIKKKHGNGENMNKDEVKKSEVEISSEISDEKVVKVVENSENRSDFETNFPILRF